MASSADGTWITLIDTQPGAAALTFEECAREVARQRAHHGGGVHAEHGGHGARLGRVQHCVGGGVRSAGSECEQGNSNRAAAFARGGTHAW